MVWFIYGNARLDRWRLDVGPVTFYKGPHLVEQLQHLDGADEQAAWSRNNLPAELVTTPEARRLNAWPDADTEWVAARVDVGRTIRPDPVQTARDLLENALELSLQGQPSAWEPWDGHAVYVDDLMASHAMFTEPNRVARWLELDHTEDHLELTGPTIAPHLGSATVDALLAAAAQDARTLRHLDAADAAAALITIVRVLERTAGLCGHDWRTHASEMLRTRVVSHVAHRGLYNTVVHHLHNDHDPANGDSYEKHLGQLRRPNRSGGVALDFAYALDLVPGLAANLERYHPHARQFRSLARNVRNPASIDRWLQGLEADFDVSLARLSRQRNAAAHGGPLHMPSATQVRAFGYQLAHLATLVALQSAIQGTAATAGFAAMAYDDHIWRAAVITAPTPKEALFGP